MHDASTVISTPPVRADAGGFTLTAPPAAMTRFSAAGSRRSLAADAGASGDASGGGGTSGGGGAGGAPLPARRFKKDLIPVGTFIHPATGQVIEATAERLEKWARNFAAMSERGIKVPVPLTHTKDPARNRGYLVDAFVEDDRLYGILELIGDDAIALASRAEVSLGVCPGFRDAHGREYGEAIDHVALVLDPVISGQGPFVPLAASRSGAVEDAAGDGEASRPVFVLSIEAAAIAPGRRLTPHDASGTDAALLAENAALRLARLELKLPRGVRDALAAALIGTAAAPRGLLLARDAEPGGRSAADAVLDALADLPDQVALGEATPTQVLELTRVAPEDAPPREDPAEIAARVRKLQGASAR